MEEAMNLVKGLPDSEVLDLAQVHLYLVELTNGRDSITSEAQRKQARKIIEIAKRDQRLREFINQMCYIDSRVPPKINWENFQMPEILMDSSGMINGSTVENGNSSTQELFPTMSSVTGPSNDQGAAAGPSTGGTQTDRTQNIPPAASNGRAPSVEPRVPRRVAGTSCIPENPEPMDVPLDLSNRSSPATVEDGSWNDGCEAEDIPGLKKQIEMWKEKHQNLTQHDSLQMLHCLQYAREETAALLKAILSTSGRIMSALKCDHEKVAYDMKLNRFWDSSSFFGPSLIAKYEENVLKLNYPACRDGGSLKAKWNRLVVNIDRHGGESFNANVLSRMEFTDEEETEIINLAKACTKINLPRGRSRRRAQHPYFNPAGGAGSTGSRFQAGSLDLTSDRLFN